MEKRPFDILHEKIDTLIGESLEKSVFTACSVGFFKKNDGFTERKILHYGFAGEGHARSMVDAETVFDLASLTKPLVTSLCVLALMQEGRLHLNDPLRKFFATDVSGFENCTLLHLLTHSSGFPAHRPYYENLLQVHHADRINKLTDWILKEKLLYEPGSDNLYSDLGFILLGRIVEKVCRRPLDEYWLRSVIRPMGLENGLFFANKKPDGARVFAATGECGWSHKRLYGLVHDDNCRVVGGVAGHAGLFGTAAAVLALCEGLLLQYRGESSHPSYSSANLRKVLGMKKGSWRFGFDTPAATLSSSGKYFSAMSIGHLGFTGTSFWIDIDRGIGIVFLTNRVLCGENLLPIKKLRPRVHDIIMEALIKKSG